MKFSADSRRIRRVVQDAAEAAFRGRIQTALAHAKPVKYTANERAHLSVTCRDELAPYELHRMARLLGVTPRWLAIGDGPMRRNA